MKWLILGSLSLILSSNLFAETWKYKLIHPNGKEELFRLSGREGQKIYLPSTKWICSFDEAESVGAESPVLRRRLWCNYGDGIMNHPYACDSSKSITNLHHAIHLFDRKSTSKKAYTLIFWCE